MGILKLRQGLKLNRKKANIDLSGGCIRILLTLLFQLVSNSKLSCSPVVLSMFQILKSDIVTSTLLFPIINYRYFEYKFAWCKIGFVSSVENKTIKPICFSPFFLFAMGNFNKL